MMMTVTIRYNTGILKGYHCVRCNAYMLQVYRVPEMATVLLPGGVNFAELSAEAAEKFQVGRTRTLVARGAALLTLSVVTFVPSVC